MENNENKHSKDVIATVTQTVTSRGLFDCDTPLLLMVSGGSDSTALAYLAALLHAQGAWGPLAMIHVNHHLRGNDADEDAAFVSQLANALSIPLFMCDINVAQIAEDGGNVEAIAREQRYKAAQEALESFCKYLDVPTENGRIITAHTQDDRVETFYMRSIVGTGPGGFRSMLYQNGNIIRPLIDVSREDLRAFLIRCDKAEAAIHDSLGHLWREDATNACTDQFRAYVRHEIVPRAQERNPRLLDTLCRSMNLIADEDDFIANLAQEKTATTMEWLSKVHDCETCPKRDTCQKQYRLIDGQDPHCGFLLLPAFCKEHVVIQRRIVKGALQAMLGEDARIETASIDAILAGVDVQNARPVSGYTANIQGNTAISANKHGIRVEPMEDYRARRKK